MSTCKIRCFVPVLPPLGANSNGALIWSYSCSDHSSSPSFSHSHSVQCGASHHQTWLHFPHLNMHTKYADPLV